MKKLIAFCVAAACLTACQKETQPLDVDKTIDYCSSQVRRALDELRQNDGTYDYTMEPRNILNGDQQRGWN